MELTINVEDYISESDIKEMCKQSVRSYIDKQISQFTNIKDFISEAVYGSISGEFLKVIFQENPEAVEKALQQLRKLVIVSAKDHYNEYFNEINNLRILGNIYENKELINETTKI